MFFLYTVENHSIIKPDFLQKFKNNKEIGKPDENLGRKATGPVKWQPAASQRNLSLGDLLRFLGVVLLSVLQNNTFFRSQISSQKKKGTQN